MVELKLLLHLGVFDCLFELSRFYLKYNKVPLDDIQKQFTSQQDFRDLPEASVIQGNLMKNTFVSDAG